MSISGLASAELILVVAQELNSSLELSEVLGNVLHITVEATKATRGSLFLLDELGQPTQRILARPNQTPKISDYNIQKVMTEGLGAWVHEYKQGTLITDTITDERWIFLPGDTNVTRSVLAVPLLYRGEVKGLLTLHHRRPGYFTENHLNLGMAIAGQAAVAIENARLFTQIRDEQESLYALLQGLPLPVIVVAEERIVFRNFVAKIELGLEAVDIPLVQMSGGDNLTQALQELQSDPTGSGLEVEWPDKRHFNISVKEISQHGTVVTLDDVTELKSLAAMKSQLVETVSHDLKNPLSHIKGFAKLLEREPLSEQGKLNLAQITRSAGLMESLIANLLDLAKIEAGEGGQIEACDLSEIAKDVLTEFEWQAQEEEKTLKVDLPPGLGQVEADRLRLREIVANLVNNSLKYTPRSGEISVSVSRQDDEIVLHVIDTGRGIPTEVLDHLFDKFYRVPITHADDWVEGTGLGLAIVKAIVEDYGGRIWVDSEVGVGSTFGCAFPVVMP